MPTSTPDVTQTAKSTPTPDMTPESVVDGDDKEVRQWIVVVASVAVLAVVATVVFVIIKKKERVRKMFKVCCLYAYMFCICYIP